MTGTTNQVQTPFGTGVRTNLANAASTESGLSLIEQNPSASVTGTFPCCFLSIWEGVSLAQNSYTPVILANYNSHAANGVGTGLPYATAIDFGDVTQLNNAFSGTIPTITTITAFNLIQISSDITLAASGLTTLTMPALKYIGGSCSLTTSALATISFPALISVNNLIVIVGNFYTTFSAPNLIYAGGTLSIFGCTGVTTIDLTSLQIAPTFIEVENNTSLTSFNLPGLISSGPITVAGNTSLTSFSLNSGLLQVNGAFLGTGGAFDQTSIDGILVSLAALDGTGGTTAYSGQIVNLTGGTNATPSATGLTAKAVLVGRGCTVTNN